MSSFGPPGVNSPHPSLPARPPPSAVSTSATASPYASTISAPPSASTTPTTSFGPSAPPPSYSQPPSSGATTYYGTAAALPQAQQQSQPRLGYSRTYAPVSGGAAAAAGAGQGRGAGGYNTNYNNTSYANNTYSYPQQQPQAPTYGPQIGPSMPPGGVTTYGPQYGPTAVVTASAPPHIRNPFPAHNQQQQYGRGGGYGGQDPRGAANYASWQSGYTANNASGDAATYGGYNHAGAGRGGAGGAAAAAGQYYGPASGPSPTGFAAGPVAYGPDGMPILPGAPVPGAEGADEATQAQQQERHKTVYRSGGGKTWTDDTLLEWDPTHLRLFVGNLAGEVTDDTLLKAFARWKSVQKALVKRDKWTKKSRGYGFVSFSDADDFFQAAKEMNGKYIGSHPVVVRKAKTEIKVAEFKDDAAGKKGKFKGGANGGPGIHNSQGAGKKDSKDSRDANKTDQKKSHAAGSGGDAFRKRDPYEPAMGPVSSGVHKHGKTKGGLKLLG